VSEPKIVIVGAGPAGMTAAIEAARAGARVTLLDESPRPGGQIYRQLDPGFRIASPGALGQDFPRGQALLAEFASIAPTIEYLPESLVWGLFPEREVAFLLKGESRTIRYDVLIVASGAYDRPVPFPGWTLPGVLTAGGAQRLVKTQRVLPGERILLVGTGPLQLALANQILHAGGRVEAIVEAGWIANWWEMARGAFGQWTLIADACRYLWGIAKARIPLLRRHIILEARGEGKVEEAVIARVDENWRAIPGTGRTVKTDAVCVGYGFVPSVELTRLAGCEHQYEPRLGGWVPVRNEHMATSVEGVYAAGDCAGVAGSFVALDEGRIAGIAAAQALGCLSADAAQARMLPVRDRLVGLRRLRAALDAISMPRVGLYELAKDDTIVCRCEEITLGEIRAVLAMSPDDMNAVKRMTRMGMGSCQGRYCGPALQEIIARERKVLPGDIVPLNPRPPVRPVPIHVLAGEGPLE
jgi:NADPH-dependent 2,4-dienoyl-CoA reductase/sulfur reductase-like enzyme